MFQVCSFLLLVNVLVRQVVSTFSEIVLGVLDHYTGSLICFLYDDVLGVSYQREAASQC